MLAAGATPEFDTNHWKVTSERDASQFYWVTKVLENCKNCELICASCNICVHMYLCTCLDFSLHTTVCKHIHVVGLKTNSKVCEREDVVASNLKYFEDILARDGCATNKDVAPLRKHSNNNSSVICCTCENQTLSAAMKHVKAALLFMEAIDSNPSSQQVLPKKRSMAPKAKQLRFSKTKKRKRPTITLPKPSYAEVKVSQRTLSHIEPNFCAICFSEDDKSYNEQIEWIPNVPCGCIVCVWVQTRNRSNVYNYHVFLLLACHEHKDASGRSPATVSVGSRFLGK